jgi:F420-0:gamma-glutamyl ligase-like protein
MEEAHMSKAKTLQELQDEVRKRQGEDVRLVIIPASWEADGYHRANVGGKIFAIQRVAGVPASARDMAAEIAGQARSAGVDVVAVEGAAILWRKRT